MDNSSTTVVVVGASRNPDRYSNKAVSQLLEHGYRVIPVNPSGGELLGLDVARKLEDVREEVDTVTLYVRPEISDGLVEVLEFLHPRRVIFNPGTENESLKRKLTSQGIEAVEFCTLVLLGTGQF
jgi:predicted CoA-binding protein